VSHDRGAVTVGNKARVLTRQVPGQSSCSRLALADAQQRYDVIGDLPSEVGLLVLVCGW